MGTPDTAAICERRIWQVDAQGARTPAGDCLVVEAPLELRMGGDPLVVVMRTPGHDRELARGLLFAEGIIDAREPLAGMSEPAALAPGERGHVLELDLAARSVPVRTMPASSSCGVCGKRALADVALRAPAIASPLTMPAALVADLPERLRRAQAVFDQTGGLHAAGAFDTQGKLLALREDVGRHNAVDKLVGWALDAGRVPLSDVALCVSGRLGFEIVQKSVMAGVPLIVAVSAPSSLAVDLAERFRVTLCGFARGGRFNVYSHASRIG
jgi:FdhD protein